MSERPTTDAALPAPFAMLGGEGVVCEGDVCYVPGARGADAVSASPVDQ